MISTVRYLKLFFLIGSVTCQYFRGRWSDVFEQELCRERLFRLDWRTMMKPCINKTNFIKLSTTKQSPTDASRSFISNYDINRAGEYSRLTIQTVSTLNVNKTTGGDTWRAFVRGQSHFEPIVFDLENGVYEVPMLFIESGRYDVDIFLEGTQCSQYADPPPDWFTKVMSFGSSLNSSMYSRNSNWSRLLDERLWEPLGGSSFSIRFDVLDGDRRRIKAVESKLNNWRSICGLTQCHFLWDGFGRWIDNRWRPFADDTLLNHPVQHINRKREGFLQFYGDGFSSHIYNSVKDDPLCTDVFKGCKGANSFIYRRLKLRRQKPLLKFLRKNFNETEPAIIRNLKRVLRQKEMNKTSAIFLNFGLDLISVASFAQFKDIVEQSVGLLKQYEGQVAWKTTTSLWRTVPGAQTRFQNYQRVMLFNAYAMEAMCEAGFPLLDLLPITASTPHQPQDGIHYDKEVIDPIESLLGNYFVQRNIL